MRLICPDCAGTDISCKICDGCFYVTPQEMSTYLSGVSRTYNVLLPSQKRKTSTTKNDISDCFSEEIAS